MKSATRAIVIMIVILLLGFAGITSANKVMGNNPNAPEIQQYIKKVDLNIEDKLKSFIPKEGPQ